MPFRPSIVIGFTIGTHHFHKVATIDASCSAIATQLLSTQTIAALQKPFWFDPTDVVAKHFSTAEDVCCLPKAGGPRIPGQNLCLGIWAFVG